MGQLHLLHLHCTPFPDKSGWCLSQSVDVQGQTKGGLNSMNNCADLWKSLKWRNTKTRTYPSCNFLADLQQAVVFTCLWENKENVLNGECGRLRTKVSLLALNRQSLGEKGKLTQMKCSYRAPVFHAMFGNTRSFHKTVTCTCAYTDSLLQGETQNPHLIFCNTCIMANKGWTVEFLLCRANMASLVLRTTSLREKTT